MIDAAIDILPMHLRIIGMAEWLGYPSLAYPFNDGLRGIPGLAIAWRNTVRRLSASGPEQEAVLDALYLKAQELGKEIPMKFKKENFDVLPTGEYVASVVDWEVVPVDQTKFGPQIKVKFDVQTTEGIRTLSSFFGTKSFGPKSKIAKLFGAVMNLSFDDLPEEPDMQDIVGRTCYITVLVKTKEDGSEFDSIEGYKPIKAQTATRPAPAPSPVSAFA